MKKTVRIGLAATIAVSTGLVSLTGTMATANADPANTSTIHAPLISSSAQNPAPGPVPGLGTPQPVTVPGESAPPVVKKQSPPVTTTTAPAANPADLPPGVPGPLDPADPAIYNSSNPAGQGISKSVANNFGTGSGTYKIGAPVAGGASSGLVPQGLESYYSQKINWESCQDYGTGNYFTGAVYTCGYAIVPLDYSKPAGATIAVAMLRVHLPGGNAKKQNLFMDPGGPGFPGMSLANGIGGYFNQAKLLGDYDLIGFDPRGVGSSAPAIQCASDKFLDAQHQGSDLLSSAELTKAAERNTQACYNNTGKGFGISGDDFIANVGTNNVVKDLDVLRSVVGDSRINYLGFSYGTSIAYHYELQFPANIRAMIIDGVVNPFETTPALAAKYQDILGNAEIDPNAQIKGFQATFEQFEASCAKNDGFDYNGAKIPCALGTVSDKATLLANYQAISQKAWGANTYGSVSLARPLSFQDFNSAAIEAMYSESLWPQLNAGLAAAKANQDVSPLIDLADSYFQRGSDGQYQSTTSAAFPTISCVDNGTDVKVDDATARLNALKTFAAAPFTDPGKNADGSQRGLEPQPDWCAFYKVKGTLDKGTELSALTNVLVISTTYDPATPYPNGVVLAKATGSTLLTVAGNDHTAYTGSHECANQITDTYLKTLTIPTDITGAQNVETKDIYSKVITGNECQVDTQWRAKAAAANAAGTPGTSVTLTANGLTRGSNYAVSVQNAAGTLLLPQQNVVAAADGSISLPFAVPADAVPGDYQITVTGTEDINKVLAPAAATLTLAKAVVTPPTTPAPTSTAPGVNTNIDGVGSNGLRPAAVVQQDDLAQTGSALLWPLLGAGSLLILGLALFLVSQQRRRTKH